MSPIDLRDTLTDIALRSGTFQADVVELAMKAMELAQTEQPRADRIAAFQQYVKETWKGDLTAGEADRLMDLVCTKYAEDKKKLAEGLGSRPSTD